MLPHNNLIIIQNIVQQNEYSIIIKISLTKETLKPTTIRETSDTTEITMIGIKWYIPAITGVIL